MRSWKRSVFRPPISTASKATASSAKLTASGQEAEESLSRFHGRLDLRRPPLSLKKRRLIPPRCQLRASSLLLVRVLRLIGRGRL